MSYKTNPIANRLNINKGYINTHFLNNKTAYNHNSIEWLSLYLFLKSYLSFKKIRLLSCETRVISQTHKVLFLSILKDPKHRKKKKYKNMYLSRINQMNNKSAIYLIYRNLDNLKNLYLLDQKKPSKTLEIYYKNINDLFVLYKRRKIFNVLKTKKMHAGKAYKLIYKNKLTTNSLNLFLLKKKDLKIQTIINQINELKKLAKIFTNNKKIKNIWLSLWVRKKLKEVRFRKKKIKKNIFRTKQRFLWLARQHVNWEKKWQKVEERRVAFYLKKLTLPHDRFLETNSAYFLAKPNYRKWKVLLPRHKMYIHYYTLYKKQNKAFLSLIPYSLKKFRRKSFNKKNLKLLSKNYKKVKRKIYRHFKLIKTLLGVSIKRAAIRNKIHRFWYTYLLYYNKKKVQGFKKLKKKKKLIFWKDWWNTFKKSFKKKKTRNKNKIKFSQKLKRKAKKLKYIEFIKKKKKYWLIGWKKRLYAVITKQIKYANIKFNIRRKGRKKKRKRLRRLLLRKKSRIKNKPSKTIANNQYAKHYYKENYFKKKVQYTTLQLQFIIEKILADHFNLSFTIKINDRLTLFNNKKVFFETFIDERRKLNKKIPSLFISSAKYKSFFAQPKINKFNILRIDNVTKKTYIENIEQKKEEFFSGHKDKILGKSFYILVTHKKYLEAQLLADEICNLLRKRKEHTPILHTVKALVFAFPENPIISYQIIVNGKMNSKSRATRVTVVKGDIPTQNYLDRINYGSAQAITPTGTFGISVYIYF